MELQKRQVSGQCVPPAVQELEITESPEGTEEQSEEARQTENPTLASGDASTEPADTSTTTSSSSSTSNASSSTTSSTSNSSSSSGLETQVKAEAAGASPSEE